MKSVSLSWRAQFLKQHKTVTGLQVRIWYGRPLDLADPDNGPNPSILKVITDDNMEFTKIGNMDSSIEQSLNTFTSSDICVTVRDKDGLIEQFINDGYYGTGLLDSTPREIVLEINASIFGSPATNEKVQTWVGYIDPLQLCRPDPRRLEIRAYTASKKAERIDFGLTEEDGHTVRNWSAKDFFQYCSLQIPAFCNYGADTAREFDAFAPTQYDLCDGRRVWNPVSRNKIDGVWKTDFEPPMDAVYKDEVQCEYYQHSKYDDNNIYYLGILQKPGQNQATSADKKQRFWTTYLCIFLVNYTDKKVSVVTKFAVGDTDVTYRGQKALRLFWPRDSVYCWILFGEKIEGKTSGSGSFWRAMRMVKVHLNGGVSGSWHDEAEYVLPSMCNYDGSDSNCGAPDAKYGTGEQSSCASKPVMVGLAHKADLVYNNSGDGFLYIMYGDTTQTNRYDLFEFNDAGQYRQIQIFKGNIWNQFGLVTYYIDECHWTEGSATVPVVAENMSTESDITAVHSLFYGGSDPAPGPDDFNGNGTGIVLTVESAEDGLRYLLLIRLGNHQTTGTWEILAVKYWMMDSASASATTPPYRGSYYRRYIDGYYYAYIPLATHHDAGGPPGAPYNIFIKDKEQTTFAPDIFPYLLQFDYAPGPATTYDYDSIQIEYVPAYYRPDFTAGGSENYLPVWLYGDVRFEDFTDPVTGKIWPRDEKKYIGYFVGYVGMNTGGADCMWLAVHGRQLPLSNNQVIPPASSLMVDGLRAGTPNWSRVYAPYLVDYYGSKRYVQPDYQIEHGIWADYIYLIAAGNYYNKTVRDALNSFCTQYKLLYGLVNMEIADPNNPGLTTFYPHLKTYDRDVAELETGIWGGPGEETITTDQYADHPVITNWQKYERVAVKSRHVEWAYGYLKAINVYSLSCDMLPAQFTMDMARLWYNFLTVARKVAVIKTNYLVHLDLMDICWVAGLLDHELEATTQYRIAINKMTFSDKDNTVELELITLPEEE